MQHVRDASTLVKRMVTSHQECARGATTEARTAWKDVAARHTSQVPYLMAEALPWCVCDADSYHRTCCTAVALGAGSEPACSRSDTWENGAAWQKCNTASSARRLYETLSFMCCLYAVSSVATERPSWPSCVLKKLTKNVRSKFSRLCQGMQPMWVCCGG